MDILSLTPALENFNTYSASSAEPGSLAYSISTELLSNQLDLVDEMGAAMIQMMEHSVTPNLGSNIDLYI